MDQVKRVNYFQGMMLVDEDFRDEQSYHRQTRHNHNLELHTWGVVRGLEVSLKAGALDVTEGLAIDANGKEIWWKGGAATAAGQPDDGAYLVIEWNEELSDEYSQMAGKYLRLIDTSKFSFKSAVEANDVVLAKISVKDGQLQERPDNSVRRTASSLRANGSDLEIRPVTSDGSLRLMNGAPLTARLTIDAKGNVGIGTTKPSFALQVGDLDTVGSLKLCVAGRGSTGNYRQWTLRTGDGDNTADIHKLRIRDEQGAGDRLVIDQNGNVGIGTTTPGGKMDISVPYNATNVLKLNQSTPSWGSQELFNTFRYITTAFAGSEGDGPFRQFNVGGGGVSIGYPGVPTYSSSDALYVNGKVGIGTTTPAGRLNISEATGTQQSPNGGTIVIDHENSGGASSIVFRSKFNRGSDYGYIQYQDDATVGGGGESSLLIIGIENDAQDHIILKPSGNVGIGTTDPKSKLDVQGAANIWSGERYAVPNGLMAPGSLTIGNIKANFGGGTTWNNNNPAALLLETLDNTEIAVHDSGRRLASLMYYEGGDVNRITIGRQMDPSWGAISTLALNGNVGIGTSSPAHKLDVYGAQGNYPGKVATSDGYMRFGPVNGGWCHFDTDRPRYYFSTGVTVNGSIASYGDGDLNLQTGDYTRMTINRSSGYVGIGKTDPQVPLDVSGARNYPLNASPDGFGPNTGFISWGDRGTNFDLSILASHWIGGAGFVANSDRRIKEIVGHSDTRKDLEIIQKLRVTEYHPLDKMAEGDSLRRGFIGQEVAEVLPQAVASRTNLIPDIYSKATDFAFDPDQKTLSITLPKPHALTKGEVVQILTEDAAKTVNVLEVPTPISFVVGEFEKEPQLVFVYGRQVDDFLAVHYEQIFTTAVGAIQELKKEKDEEVKALRTEMAELRAANDDLTKRLQLLESKMETASGLMVAKTSNGNGRH